MLRSFLLASLLLATAVTAPACGTSDAASPPPVGPTQATPASTDAKAGCVELFTRNRTCTAQYIPALVDLRAKYDAPAGIAAEVAAHRDDVIAQAMTEWATDSTDAAIDALCTKIVTQTPPAVLAESSGAMDCLANQDCGAYTACVMPYFEKRFSK
jgi:hypothetical protein